MAARNSERRTVIPNAGSDIKRSTMSSGFPANAGYQSFFMEGQDALNIARAARRTAKTVQGRVPSPFQVEPSSTPLRASTNGLVHVTYPPKVTTE